MYTDLKYTSLIVLHILLGFIIFNFEPLAILYGFIILIVGIFWIWRNNNQNEEALMVCAYLMGAEVFLRMTKGTVNHEYVKYSIIFVLFVGMYFKGFSRNALPYWIFLLLLLPGAVLGMVAFENEERLRQSIMFNLSGPLCLTVASLYCYNRKIKMKQLMEIFLYASIPIVSCSIYLVLYTPDLRETLTTTGSNFSTSGGFGPNQVSTILGLGLFLFFTRALFASPTRWQLIINLLISFFLTYRALLTFSRGGLITGLLMVVLLIGVILLRGNTNARLKIFLSIGVMVGALFMIWIYTVFLTGGLIEKRYANQDAQGRDKVSLTSGREQLAESEIELFLKDPLWGGGVGSGTYYRKQKFDATIASHNEVPRMLGEHGLFGIVGLFLLLVTPTILYLDNTHNFFVISLLAFWFLTLNHAAMRTAAPAFIYALTLLKIQLDDIPVIRRKQTNIAAE
jgi:hypothetical protein